MIASAFAPRFAAVADVLIYAAGVADSSCSAGAEYDRERLRLEAAMASAPEALVVYFGTCSAGDPALAASPYVVHKQAMEACVRAHPRHLVVRLPQVAGPRPNPRTYVAYLHACIRDGERFALWANAWRNVIGVDDVVAITGAMLAAGVGGETVDVAAPESHRVADAVAILERVTGRRARCDVVAAGSGVAIDVSRSLPFATAAGVRFDAGYLERTLRRYFG